MPVSTVQKVREIIEVMDEARNVGVINDWQYGFFEDVKERVALYGAHTLFSKKQEAVVDSAYESVCAWDEPTRRV